MKSSWNVARRSITRGEGVATRKEFQGFQFGCISNYLIDFSDKALSNWHLNSIEGEHRFEDYETWSLFQWITKHFLNEKTWLTSENLRLHFWFSILTSVQFAEFYWLIQSFAEYSLVRCLQQSIIVQLHNTKNFSRSFRGYSMGIFTWLTSCSKREWQTSTRSIGWCSIIFQFHRTHLPKTTRFRCQNIICTFSQRIYLESIDTINEQRTSSTYLDVSRIKSIEENLVVDFD